MFELDIRSFIQVTQGLRYVYLYMVADYRKL